MTPHQVKTALQSLSDGDRVSILIDPRLSLLACRVADPHLYLLVKEA